MWSASSFPLLPGPLCMRTELIPWSFLRQQFPSRLFCLTSMVCKIGGKWPYKCFCGMLLPGFFKTPCSIPVYVFTRPFCHRQGVTQGQFSILSTTGLKLTITHSYLLEGKQQPMCYVCQTKYSMKHILIECTGLVHIRKTFYSANNMKELFQNTEINNVILFLKTVKLYTKI